VKSILRKLHCEKHVGESIVGLHIEKETETEMGMGTLACLALSTSIDQLEEKHQ
jgi:hypothetical protein